MTPHPMTSHPLATVTRVTELLLECTANEDEFGFFLRIQKN
ncbi:MAG: hypothetical protein ACI9OW_000186 [Marinobacter psychrophilus]|jgi:hypothetical protein